MNVDMKRIIKRKTQLLYLVEILLPKYEFSMVQVIGRL